MPEPGRGIALAKRAVTWLYRHNPDYVIRGCSDVAETLAAFLRRRGFSVKIIYGIAGWGELDDPLLDLFEHAWLEVDGRRFDPTLWVQKVTMPTHYYRESRTVSQRIKEEISCAPQFERWKERYADELDANL